MALGEKKGFFGRLSQKLNDVFALHPTPDEDMLEELEDVLITSDLGVETTLKIIEQLRHDIRRNYIYDADGVRAQIKSIVADLLDKGERLALCEDTPLVIVMIGVNGVGKTTTIAKLAHMLKGQGKSVLLVAADTFRAAAAEQLTIWADRVEVPIVKHAEGADPSAVIFDGLQAAKARGTDVVICDTAGRLHNKKNLMNELAKMNKVIDREFPGAARETLLVLDATTGKNAVSQAKEFAEVAGLTGIVLTKLDGTAKGGIVVTISDEFDLPVKFVGLGEGLNDLKVFSPQDFADSIFEGDQA
ncbi:MAG: signal recognition particle-docking protein FtsY [Firmicutes bacterium]|nr:signal recognition particle-docking protein FtsY [Bacillota bacterium]MBR3302317.1 signal recognition particle-docking protein FtsY [Bacillota bacterium]MBR6236527.1 signal recognition particle-docking protein FtsY [Bacillota bacterium]